MMRLPAPLGDIRVVEVLEYYDEPVLYFGQSATEQNFLVMLAADDPNQRQWVLSPMSSVRLAAVREQALDLYSAFTRAEGGIVWRATERRGSHEPPAIELVRVEDLDDDVLPEPGFFAEPFEQAEPASLPDTIALARACQRDVLMLHMFPRVRARHEVPLAELGRAATGTQGVVYALDAYLAGKTAKKGQYSKQTLENGELVAAASHAASFAVELRSAGSANLFGETSVSGPLGSLFNLLDAVATDDALREALPGFAGTRVPAKLRELLSSIVEKMPAVEFIWASPAPGSALRRSFINLERAREAISLIGNLDPKDPIEFEAHGRLEAADANSKLFKFFDEREAKTYVGRASDDISLAGVVIRKQKYAAQIREIQEIDPAGDLRVKYILLELVLVTPEPSPEAGLDT